MAAGESAYDVARRQREKAERLQRSAALWEQGAEGEVAVARALEALPDGWFGLHDLAWPGRPKANIDHIVVGPGGVFVVDAKNWTGRIEVRDQVLMQNGRRREPAVASAAEAALALQYIVPVSHLSTSVLCFVRDEPLTGWARDVMVCSTATLTAMLTSRPAVLSPDDVRACVEAVRVGTATRTAPPLVTRRPTSSRHTTKKRSRPVVALVGTLALLVAVWSGGLQHAGGWVGQRFVEVMAPDEPPKPAPTKPTKPTKQERKQKEQKAKQPNQPR
ncbi:NERD domain-containing protein [Nocardioides sp. zg-1308]|uniref:nuclease-related domain-containing protein n=1 Tax=Nocardioides sp. zg-1308 TaxID=2736253 RepID=UPI001556E456|nr:nuclease-related domain-containing protein [Nocardioides sp. zg-1308]NPD03791.1 NERD domain-containing protein [Nocardioides sp. zg-1308]